MIARTIHLRPTAALAERVLLPGDPGRALTLAQHLLEAPLMFNHHRGLWGYTGQAPDGEPLTIQSTGMGGPSAAIVLEELILLGVRRAIRIGTCGALDGGLALGDLVIARESLAADGASRALGAGERVAADATLTAALERAASADRIAAHCDQKNSTHQTASPNPTHPPAPTTHSAPSATTQATPRRAALCHTHAGATIVSTDLFYDPDDSRAAQWCEAGAVAVEMEAATLFALGARLATPVACALVVSDLIHDGRERIDDDSLVTAAEAMGRVAVAALAN